MNAPAGRGGVSVFPCPNLVLNHQLRPISIEEGESLKRMLLSHRDTYIPTIYFNRYGRGWAAACSFEFRLTGNVATKQCHSSLVRLLPRIRMSVAGSDFVVLSCV